MQVSKDVREDAVGDVAVLIDIQGVEEGLVHEGAGIVLDAHVKLMSVLTDLDRGLNHANAEVQLTAGVLEPFRDGAPLELQIIQAIADLCLWERRVHQCIEKAFLLFLEFAEFGGEVRVQRGDCLLLASNCIPHFLAECVGEVGWKGERCVVVLHFSFHLSHAKMGQVATTTLASPADVVAMDGAASALRFRVDQTGRAASLMTPIATQESFQVVVVLALSRASRRAGLEDVLHLVEELLADD